LQARAVDRKIGALLRRGSSASTAGGPMRGLQSGLRSGARTGRQHQHVVRRDPATGDTTRVLLRRWCHPGRSLPVNLLCAGRCLSRCSYGSEGGGRQGLPSYRTPIQIAYKPQCTRVDVAWRITALLLYPPMRSLGHQVPEWAHSSAAYSAKDRDGTPRSQTYTDGDCDQGSQADGCHSTRRRERIVRSARA
jgi:hypothetical protein